MMDTVISGRAFVNGGLTGAEIGIEDGRIVAVGRSLSGGDRRIDFGDRVILPGFVDPHVHFRDPGMTHKEDFPSGTMSAVNGGVTCILDMPNTKPPVSDIQSLTDKKSVVRGRAYTDYGLFAAVTDRTDAAKLAPLVPGFKLFMGSTTGNILMNDDDAIAAAFRKIAPTGKRISVHAEDNNLILSEKETCCRDHLRNRPSEAEYSAIRRLSKFRGMKVNICHNTDARSVAMASELGFTTEVALHHLLFDADRNPGAEYKVNPPLRETATRDGLFKAFSEGKITMFGTDHAPHTQDEKSQDYDSAPGGIPGVETSMPIVMNMVKKNVIPLATAVRMGSEAPALSFGIRKGRIEVGYDADFSVFDTRNVVRIDEKRLHSKAGFSPYREMEAIFPDTVIIRGQIQMKDGEFCGDRIGEDVCGGLRG